jgi:CBS domain-containing protein
MTSSVGHRRSSAAGPHPQTDPDLLELRNLLRRVEAARSNYDPRVFEGTEIAILRWFEPLLDELVVRGDCDRSVVLSDARANLARLVTTWRGGDEEALVASVQRTILVSSEGAAGSGHLDLTSSVRLGEVMSSPAVTLRGWMQTVDAARVLVENGFTAAPVVDDRGELVGIVTEADLLLARLVHDAGVEAAAARTREVADDTAFSDADPDGDAVDVGETGGPPEHRPGVDETTTVAEVMSSPVEALQVSVAVGEAARLMLRRHLRSVPVCDGHRVVGVVTRRDLLRATTEPAH